MIYVVAASALVLLLLCAVLDNTRARLNRALNQADTKIRHLRSEATEMASNLDHCRAMGAEDQDRVRRMAQENQDLREEAAALRRKIARQDRILASRHTVTARQLEESRR